MAEKPPDKDTHGRDAVISARTTKDTKAKAEQAARSGYMSLSVWAEQAILAALEQREEDAG